MLLLASARRTVRLVGELQQIFLAVTCRRTRRQRLPRCGAGSIGPTPPPSSRDYYDLVHVNCGFFLDVMSFIKKKRISNFFQHVLNLYEFPV
jgi:hypothetical protein